uniref:Uncharacterized protein n=1 Tax=Rhizophora mucronata TaxID=61149 RepID=A0A2P2P6B1_RHIMU
MCIDYFFPQKLAMRHEIILKFLCIFFFF